MVILVNENGTSYTCNGINVMKQTDPTVVAKLSGSISNGGGGVPVVHGLTDVEIKAAFNLVT